MLELKNVSKTYGDFTLKEINLSVKKGEYFVMLGISGAGKSVLLEMIIGLETPDSGDIYFNRRKITQTKIQDRGIGIVFQDFAIFPHMSVLENIIYPLKNIKISKKEAIARAKDIASEMSISHLLKRMPTKLSGGELQRVALARTLAIEPEFLLLDEPMASVDILLQEELRALLRKINRKGITILHVTHNYKEAISLAERIAVIHQGKLIQTGTAKEVFHNPKSEFIANFTGIKNFYRAVNVAKNLSLAENRVEIKHQSSSNDKNGYLMFRSEDVIISDTAVYSSALNNFQGKIVDFFPCTYGFEVLVDIGIKVSTHITQTSFDNFKIELGKKIWISFKATTVKFISHEDAKN